MTRAARLESIVQVVILLIMGGTAGAASFTHIHDLTVANGQPGWIGWANAVVVELMSIASGLELRRRKRTGQSTGFVYAVLFAAVVVSLAAQVARAKPSVWGWIVAALPALAFLAIVKIVLTRTPVVSGLVRTGLVSGPDQTDVEEVGPVETVDQSDVDAGPMKFVDRSTGPEVRTYEAASTDSSPTEQVLPETADGPDEVEQSALDRTVEDPIVPAQRINDNDVDGSQSRPTEDERPSSRSGRPRTRTGPDHDRSDPDSSGPDGSGPDRVGPDLDVSVLDRTGLDDELLELGRTIATTVRMRGDTLTRDVLIDEIRRKGQTIGTDRASKLLNWLKVEIKKAEAVPAGAD